MHLLVTGAAGRLGRDVVRYFHQRGLAMTATDMNPDPGSPVPVQVVDLDHRQACYQLMDGVDAVIHLGNIASAGRGNPQHVFGTNVRVNLNVFQTAAEMGVRKMLWASSVQVISGALRIADGEAPKCFDAFPLSEETVPNPGNCYALSKQVGEETLAWYAKKYDMQAIAFRLPWIRRQDDAVHYRTTRRRRRSTRIADYFAFIWANDVCDLLARCLEQDLPGYRVYFPTSKEPVNGDTVPEIYRRYYSGVPLTRPLEDLDSLVDHRMIEEETGWKPSPGNPGPDAS